MEAEFETVRACVWTFRQEAGAATLLACLSGNIPGRAHSCREGTPVLPRRPAQSYCPGDRTCPSQVTSAGLEPGSPDCKVTFSPVPAHLLQTWLTLAEKPE